MYVLATSISRNGMACVPPVVALYFTKRYWCSTDSKFSYFYFLYTSTLLSSLRLVCLKSQEFLHEHSLWLLYRSDWVKRGIFIQKRYFLMMIWLVKQVQRHSKA